MSGLFKAYFISLRLYRSVLRQPWYIASTMMQPVLILVLIGQLFQHVSDIPGFPSKLYSQFLVPGLVMMSSLSLAAWSGLEIIDDMKSELLERFVVATAGGISIIGGRMIYLGGMVLIRASLLIFISVLLPANGHYGFRAVAILLATALLITVAFGTLSIAFGLTIAQRESFVSVVGTLEWPLIFLSPVFMSTSFMPVWMQRVVRWNPLTWATTIGQASSSPQTVPLLFQYRFDALIMFAVLSCVLALTAFTRYQRSL